MSNKYKEIMDRVTLSDEAYDKIQKNINNYSNSKIVSFTNWKKYTAMAAALAVVVVGGSVIYMQSNVKGPTESAYMLESSSDLDSGTYEAATEEAVEGATGDAIMDSDSASKGQSNESTQIANPLVEYDSIEALCEAAGFTIKELNTEKPPFKITSTTYILIGGTTAEITYYGGDDKAIRYRMAEGQKDISGDYTDYEYTREEFHENGKITLKGHEDDSKYNLALWQDSHFSYSLQMEPAQSFGRIEMLLQ